MAPESVIKLTCMSMVSVFSRSSSLLFVSSIMYDVSRNSVLNNISELFTKANEMHNHETRFSSLGNLYVQS